MNMFSNVNVFKETFKRRLAEKYSTSIELSHVTEQFDILGEMVRDYANYDWRAVRTEVKEEDKKQLIYFSMEFLMGRLLLNNLQNLGIYDIAKKGLEELGIDINKLEEVLRNYQKDLKQFDSHILMNFEYHIWQDALRSVKCVEQRCGLIEKNLKLLELS